MKKAKKILFTFLLLTMCFSMSIPASAAVKISAKKVTLTVGQSKTLKIKGTKKKVKWSSNKKSVATVSAKGKVTAKKNGTATITAKVGKKKYTCKVTVKSQKATEEEKPKKETGSVTHTSYSTPMGIVVICKNNYSYPVDIEVDCMFYGQSGGFISKSSNSNYATPPGAECALMLLRTYNLSLYTCKSYKVAVNAKRANYVSTGHNFSITKSMGINSTVVEIKNNGYSNDFTKVAVVFYKEGKIIGCDEYYADVKYVGSSDILEFFYPYDSNYDTIYPDDCEVYINSSYSYVW